MNDLDPPNPDQAIKRDLGQFLPRLRRFCLALTAAPADADDLCQSTLERAISRLDLWTPGTRLDSWLYRMAQNLHKNALRDNANRLRLLETACEASHDRREAPGHEEASELRRHVLALPEDQRKVLILISVEGYSYKECAELLDLPQTTVTNRLFQARMRLRQVMEADADYEDDTTREASA
jgi:RNA polymerase sigma-70 factor (ECF subfamily)